MESMDDTFLYALVTSVLITGRRWMQQRDKKCTDGSEECKIIFFVFYIALVGHIWHSRLDELPSTVRRR